MPQSVSVVVELEQVRGTERERPAMMLRRLAEEVRSQASDQQIRTPVELLVCLDEVYLDRGQALVLAALGDDTELFELRFLPGRDPDYYELKNLGVAEAGGDLVVFLDCDVVPEHGWLGGLLHPFEDPRISVVAGNSYVEPTSVYNRTFALTWIFPLRSRSSDVRPISRLATNNAAFRREVAERFPFPSMTETSRGSCQLLQATMERHGVNMVTSCGARVIHPAPAWPQQFLVRALARGRDRLLFAEPGPSRTFRGTAARLRSDIVGFLLKLFRGRNEVGLSVPALAPASAIAISFALCSALGELLTMMHRSFMIRHFRV
jgi:hypothetical protein